MENINTLMTVCPGDLALLDQLKELVHKETFDSLYYALLLVRVPDNFTREVLLELSNEERRHAGRLSRIHAVLTGLEIPIPEVNIEETPLFDKAVQEQVLAEASTYKTYGKMYLQARHPYLKHLFYTLQMDEFVHISKLNLLLWKWSRENPLMPAK